MTWEVLRRSGQVGTLTSSEQSVAGFYARSLPGAAFMNLQQVASASGVSTASVTRFARKLGYEDFRGMAASLQGDARSVLERPGDRLGTTPAADDRFSRAAADLQATAASLDTGSVHRGVELLADTTRPVLLAAVASGQPLVEHTGLLLSYLRGNVRVLGGTDRWAHEIADLTARHVVLVTAYDRDPLPVLHLVERARSIGASTIAVTNVATSPLLSSAEVPLRISTAPGTPFGSRVALLAALETLVDGVAAAQPEGRRRADAIEQSFDALGIHPRATPRLSDS
ncbi:MurR/RpiR family transcriptional regulator [Kocuria sp.]|uniref:MurR/RpiR family transcriptional regulator n=1 Tax=Kocuria sp. TaxID=1871328 RepID=UPI0026DAEEA5|nr:MurR/RpiR family transcriptional regulator [Kocuria sp.]MDO4918340.1 MurR/RpiR family transcriptional regulator [Kocuria sp.]